MLIVSIYVEEEECKCQKLNLRFFYVTQFIVPNQTTD